MEQKQLFLDIGRKQAERFLKRYSVGIETKTDDQFISLPFKFLDNPKFRNGLMTKRRFRTYL
jgi:hypothetical protein